jgi:hypothetical protein
MFNVSKKSVLLSIIFFTALHTQCSEFDNIQTSKRTITLQIDEIPRKEEPFLWKAAAIVGPTIASAVITYALRTWYDDPEIREMDKEIKKIELETKKHPDYPTISMLLEKNKAREKTLEAEVTEANLIKHYQDELVTFLRCDQTLYTQDYCNFMANIHQQKLNHIMNLNNARS